ELRCGPSPVPACRPVRGCRRSGAYRSAPRTVPAPRRAVPMQRAWVGCWGRRDRGCHLLLPLVRTWPGTLDDSAPLLLTVGTVIALVLLERVQATLAGDLPSLRHR